MAVTQNGECKCEKKKKYMAKPIPIDCSSDDYLKQQSFKAFV